MVHAGRFIRNNKKFLFGAIVLFLYILVAVFADKIAPYSYSTIGLGEQFEPAGPEFYFGTDNLGRDIFTRLVYGTRISLKVGITCVLIALAIGVPCGLFAGYVGGWADLILMRLSDILLSIPTILMAVLVTTIIGGGQKVVIIAVGLTQTPGIMRLTRSIVLSVREREFVEAAEQLGESRASILFKQILPNSASAIIVRATTLLANAILNEASISYLGYGTQAPDPSWGLMLTDSQNYIYRAPMMAVYPGIALVLLVFAVNMFGDGLRDLIDPKYKGKVIN